MADEAAESTSTEAATSAAPSDGGGIKTAAEVIEKVLAADKPEATKPAAEAKPVKPAKPDPTRRVEKLEAKAVEKAATAEAEPDADASAIAKARYHLQHGDVAKFIDTVVGDFKADGLPDAVREALGRKLGVGSAQWEKIRKYEQGAKRAVAAREQELRGVVQQLQAEYKPFHEARSLYQAGDYDAAFKAAFGEDAADYQRKVIGQRIGKNPEVEKLRAELEAERAERRQIAEREQAAAQEADQHRQVQEYVQSLGSTLSESEDPWIAKRAERPAFVQRVYAIQRESYDSRSNTFMPTHLAAEQARDEIQSSIKAWSDDDTGAPPAKAAQASALPAKPPVAKAPARALKQSQAAEGTGKPVKETSAQVRERYQRQMEQATD